jgi:hypothetical protein
MDEVVEHCPQPHIGEIVEHERSGHWHSSRNKHWRPRLRSNSERFAKKGGSIIMNGFGDFATFLLPLGGNSFRRDGAEF